MCCGVGGEEEDAEAWHQPPVWQCGGDGIPHYCLFGSSESLNEGLCSGWFPGRITTKQTKKAKKNGGNLGGLKVMVIFGGFYRRKFIIPRMTIGSSWNRDGSEEPIKRDFDGECEGRDRSHVDIWREFLNLFLFPLFMDEREIIFCE